MNEEEGCGCAKVEATKCIEHIIKYYKNEMMKNLIPALAPYKEYLSKVVEIKITIGEI